ncbi:hypothetical protein BP6252_10851 [Coleophoma cylindrospora]|uniref:Heterokaryon incompatibility domain-containing protein n=1 Tax=Coleophoma cylindrospora TaxID=1849047 RepID=A0A3D8QNA7_9HELO|nr:hypothetical protein BP6252_10851 [Coleophoma cylindrospora]
MALAACEQHLCPRCVEFIFGNRPPDLYHDDHPLCPNCLGEGQDIQQDCWTLSPPVPNLKSYHDTIYQGLPREDEIPDFEKKMMHWPRRLLHLPTMTSYPWKLGNIYNNAKDPVYDAVSYTWGRMMMKRPGQRRLKIRGIPWRVPRLRPNFLKVRDFINLFRSLQSKSTEWLWIDIACIDQRRRTVSDLEVGRQAGIFKGARRVYIWWSTFDTKQLATVSTVLKVASHKSEEILQRVVKHDRESQQPIFEDMQVAISSENHWFIQTKRAFEKLAREPWSSSLWVLQEAHLRLDATILPREASDSCRCLDSLVEDITRVAMLSAWMITVRHEGFPWKNPSTTRLIGISVQMFSTILKGGYHALGSGSAIAIFSASAHRRTSRKIDDMLGIQQIFGYRLGEYLVRKPEVQSNDGDDANLKALEFEFGCKILERHPVASQLYTFGEAKPGTRWKINKTCGVLVVPFATNSWEFPHQRLCRLSVIETKEINEGWGYFEGMACPFSLLELAWRSSVDFESQLFSFVNIRLDAPEDESEGQPPGRFHPNDPNRCHHEYARWLKEISLGDGVTEEQIIVLLLGRTLNKEAGKSIATEKLQEYSYRDTEEALGSEGRGYQIGLILRRRQTCPDLPQWRRLGLCTWQNTIGCPLLNGQGERSALENTSGILVGWEGAGWYSTSGTFG